MSDEARAGGAVGDVEAARELLDKLSDHITEDYDYRGDVCGSSFRSEAEDILAAALQREREGVGRDGERLDWLEKRHADVYWLGGTIDTWAIALNEDAPEVRANTLREAIDNAIQGDAAQGEGGGGSDGG